MKSKKIVIGIAAVALLALMISNVYAHCGCHPGLSPGYWKHNVKVYNGGPGAYSAPFEDHPHETSESMLGYADVILGPEDQTLEQENAYLVWANGIFQSKDPLVRAGWLDLANAFNAAAGYNPYVGD